MDYEKLCKGSPKLGLLKPSEKGNARIKESLKFLGWDVKTEETQDFAVTVTLLGIATCTILFFIVTISLGLSPLWLVFFGFPALLFFYLKKYPVLKADSERRKAIGQMPEVTSYLIMSLRINPNPEKAVQFAAAHSHGFFRRRFDRIMSEIRSGRGSAESGLAGFGTDFAAKSEEFSRAMKLIISSTLERTENRRQETLDKASQVLLDGIAARTEREARALHTPVMMVFTFGVILPLVFVAIIPFMSLMGIRVGEAVIAVMYVVGLPLLLFFLIRFVASNRPATVAPPEVIVKGGDTTTLAVSIAAGALAGSLIFLGDSLGAMRYLPVLWGIGAGVGCFLLMATKGAKKQRTRVKKAENNFPETLHTLGILLSEGKPLELAMYESGQFLLEASQRIKTLGVSPECALFDEKNGALKGLKSGTIRGVMDVLISVSDKGSEAMANVASRMSAHLANLKKNELEIERSLGGIVSSMKIIALFVAPLVGGMISSMSVVLADTISETGNANMGMGGAVPIDPSLVAAIIGAYVMESAAVLTLFGTDLMDGDDKVMKKYSLGLALPVSILIFTVCLAVANMLFGGLG